MLKSGASQFNFEASKLYNFHSESLSNEKGLVII